MPLYRVKTLISNISLPDNRVYQNANTEVILTEKQFRQIQNAAYIGRYVEFIGVVPDNPGSGGSPGGGGTQGLAGPPGPQGSRGLPGAQGETGPVGPAGAPGPKGDTGERGLAGADGARGAQGPEGVAGAVGPQGPRGETGAAGAVGPKGDTGPAGATGATGPQGPVGPQGSPGAAGAQGPKGDTGAAGPQGAQGLKGDTGAAGPQGAQGLKGDTGAAGPQGPKGDVGPAGAEAIRRKVYTGGTLSVSAASWTDLFTSAMDIVIPAAVGDCLDIYGSFFVVPVTSGQIVQFSAFSVNGATLTTLIGGSTAGVMPGWSSPAAGGGPGMPYITRPVVAADIVGGNVTVRLRARLAVAGTARTISADATTPFIWWVSNRGNNVA